MEHKLLPMNGFGCIPTGLPGGFFVYEAQSPETILFADQNVIRLFGCETFHEFMEYVGSSFQGMVHPEDLYKIENQIQAQTLFGEKRHDYVRYRIITKQGKVRYIEDFGHLLHMENGKSVFYVFIVDVDQNEYLNNNRNSFAEAELLSRNQETDSLTGLFNMSFFYYKIQMMLAQPESWRQQIAFVYFDIPNFKLYNERHGFKLGDELLFDFAKIIRECFAGATAARFSDDRFFVCATGSREEIVSKVENVYKRMLLADDINKKVRIKAGIYFQDSRRAEVGLACDHARLACSSIKRRHDVNYCIYDEMLRERLRKQQYVVDHIEEAIEKGYIRVFYQPVIRVRTGEICGFEALVRWIDPQIGMLSPADFIETLEQFHLIHLVDQYVIRKVCSDYREMLDAGKPLVPASVNISRLDFELCDIFSYVEEMRRKYDVPMHMLDLEITESALNDNVGYIKSECDRMRNLGYHIWLDDFGSGYSSLNTIAEYEFDVLKLDMVFLRGFERNEKTATLMKYIMKGANDMKVSPLCEGVETAAHYEFLKQIHCERAQGYFFGKPMPLEEAQAYIAEKGYKLEQTEPESGQW
ncbi:MAG: GGDEF and EAL domain-containing protein [Oscillospiraceae bacterium]|nr:GGDEF and EAL domain-containing protein [Oscillospiraceae bacterium]